MKKISKKAKIAHLSWNQKTLTTSVMEEIGSNVLASMYKFQRCDLVRFVVAKGDIMKEGEAEPEVSASQYKLRQTGVGRTLKPIWIVLDHIPHITLGGASSIEDLGNRMIRAFNHLQIADIFYRDQEPEYGT